MSDRLDKLVREARSELGAREAQNINWDSVDAALFDRIRKERRAERLSSSSFRPRAWHFAALAVAGAAIVAVALCPPPRPRFVSWTVPRPGGQRGRRRWSGWEGGGGRAVHSTP